MTHKLELYCVTNKLVPHLENLPLQIGCVSVGDFPSSYIRCDNNVNIFHKEKYYSELTFQYWYWKNKFNLKNDNWIGFCQKRRFWLNKDSNEKEINQLNFKDKFLNKVPNEWESFDSIVCKKIDLKDMKKMKMIKRGYRSIIKDPSILFDKKKHTINLHFDMHHGNGNLTKAASFLEDADRDEFLEYINTSTSFHPNIMFIAKAEILNKWFNSLFPWLEKCEKVFGFDNLHGYDTQRLYAFLAERYLSFWFKKYTKSLEWSWTFFEAK